MEYADLLYLLAEIAAVLVGFVGLSAAFQSGYKGKFVRNVRMGQRYILLTAVILLFAALLPLVLDALLIAEPLVWKISAALYGLFAAAVRLEASRILAALPGDAKRKIGRGVMEVTGAVSISQVGLAVAILFGPATWPAGGLYILMLYLGMGTTISIFASTLLPRRDRLLSTNEAGENEDSNKDSDA